ncbi:hypothetical protein KIL84_013398 [Mauremys mutica]|uniref:Uncharacterized protein n=1 Tax=Mauremys mutica TaxID=74926 RepID=A0A9D4AS28_9SAUR|nr:hypothetical protein KIL84_013398 [Mauremys mutica]
MVQNAPENVGVHPTQTLLVQAFPMVKYKSPSPMKVVKKPKTSTVLGTRLLLNAVCANTAFGSLGVKGTVVIRSPDTDILVLAVQYFPKMEHIGNMGVETGTITNTTGKCCFILVCAICDTLLTSATEFLLYTHYQDVTLYHPYLVFGKKICI